MIKAMQYLSTIFVSWINPISWDFGEAKMEGFVQVRKEFLAKHFGDSIA